MGLINPPFTVTVTVERPNYDNRGNRNPSTHTLEAVVSMQPAQTRPRLSEGTENRFIQDAALFVRRGSDIRAGDEVLYNGVKFVVSGHARGDQLHPLTGDDFGWMQFRMQGFG